MIAPPYQAGEWRACAGERMLSTASFSSQGMDRAKAVVPARSSAPMI